MVNVTPNGTVTLHITRWGLSFALQIVFVGMLPHQFVASPGAEISAQVNPIRVFMVPNWILL